MIVLGTRSLQRLQEVHLDLYKVVVHAAEITPPELDFTVLEGLRTIERQRVLVKAGASQTMKSRHLTGHAVDLAVLIGGQVAWDWPLYHRLAVFVKEAARNVGVPIEWGGDWEKFKDGPHWQLPWKDYP